MKQGMTLTELAAEVERRKGAKHDVVATTPSLTLATAAEDTRPGTSRLDVEGRPEFDGGMPVTDYAHRQIGDRLGVPAKYYDRLRADHPALLDGTVNYLFRHEPERRMVRTLDGRVRAFLSDRYRRIDNEDVAEVVVPIIAEQMATEDARVESCDLTDTKMYLKVVLPRRTADVRVGDPVQYGYVVQNSEVGAGALSVAPFTYTLVCRNGMVAQEWGERRYHVGSRIEGGEESRALYRDSTLRKDDEALMAKIEDVVRGASSDIVFESIVGRLRELAGIRIEGDPVKSVEVLQQRTGITDDERGSVLRYLVEGGDLSAYGLLNALTRTAEDAEGYDRATELETLGGSFLSMEERVLAPIMAGAGR